MADTSSSGVGISWGTKEHAIAVAKLSADSGIIDDDAASLTTTYSSTKIEEVAESAADALIDDSQTAPGTGSTVYSTEKMLAGDLAVNLGAVEAARLTLKGGAPLLRLPLATYTLETLTLPLYGGGLVGKTIRIRFLRQDLMVIANCEAVAEINLAYNDRLSVDIPVIYVPPAEATAMGGWIGINGASFLDYASKAVINPIASRILWSRIDNTSFPATEMNAFQQQSLMWFMDDI